MNKKNIYKILEDNQVIIGYVRSSIYDLSRNTYYLIPNDLAELLNKIRNNTNFNVLHDTDYNEEYIDFLLEKEIIFKMNPREFNMFPKLELKWDSPSLITALTIEIDDIDCTTIQNYLDFSDYIGCKNIQFILLDYFNVNKIRQLLEMIQNSKINTLEVIAKFNSNINYSNQLPSLYEDYPQLNSLIFYLGPCKEILYKTISNNYAASTPELLTYKQSIYPSNFTINTSFFSESHVFNTFFNRRLFIDKNKLIKNSQNNENDFGKYENNFDNIEKIINSHEFQNIWYANKNNTDVCKDCEFRYMCFDSRIPTQRADNTWYHTIECDYNPYIAKWLGEEGYQTLATCSVVSNAEGFNIDTEKLAIINKELWEED